MTYKIDLPVIILSILLLLLSAVILLKVYSLGGLGWDFVNLFLTGKSLLNPTFYQQHLPVNTTIKALVSPPRATKTIVALDFQDYYITTSHIYISLVKEPIVPVILAIVTLISSTYNIQIYLILLLILLLAASFYVSKELNVNPLVLSALLFSPYILQWTFLYTSQEILSLILALFAIGLLARRSSLAGVAIALVGLTKYPGLILLPLILLLLDPKDMQKSGIKVAKAGTLFVLTTLPWLIFNFIYFGNSLISYTDALRETVQNNTHVTISAVLNAILAIPTILLYPILLIIFLIVWKMLQSSAVRKSKSTDEQGLLTILYNLDYKYKITLSFLVLSTIGFILVYNNAGEPPRFAYLLYGAGALVAALYTDSISMNHKIEKYIPYALCALSIVLLIFLYLSISPATYESWYVSEGNSNNATILSAVNAITANNFAGCAVVSNAWPFLNYYNIVSYESGECTAAMWNYPSVFFSNIGPNTYCGYALNASQVAQFTITGSGYGLNIPPNYTCERTSN